MNRGKIVVEGKPEELKNSAGERVVQVISIPGNYHSVKIKIESLEAVMSCSVSEKGLKISLRGELPFQAVLEAFGSEGEKIKNVESGNPSLEDVFIQAAGEAWH